MEVGIFPDPPGTKYTHMRWAISGDGFRKLLKYIHDRYDPPGGIQVTENGLALKNDESGQERIDFFNEYLGGMKKAIDEDGVRVSAYYAWSFMDNFEWSFGYSKRFGLVEVDYDTLERKPRPIAAWFTELMKGNKLPSSASA